jgi:hypothetical protein
MATDDCVTYDELPDIVRAAVRQALEDYEHECILHLKPGDAEHVRDLVGAIKEIGGGDLARGIVVVRENHKFVVALHQAAAKIGWGVIILAVSVMGTLGLVAAGVWQKTNGGS